MKPRTPRHPVSAVPRLALVPALVTAVLATTLAATMVAPAAGAATRPPSALDRAHALRALDNPLLTQVRASHPAGSTASRAGALVAPHHSTAFLAALKTPTLVFTRLDPGTSFALETKNLLTGTVADLIGLSPNICPIAPRLSADTTMVVFVDYGASCSLNGSLKVLTIATSTITTLSVASAQHYLSLPNFSPDGSTVLYTDETDDSLGNFVTSQLNTVASNGLSPPVALGGGGVSAYDGVYSPDGTKIAFSPDAGTWLSLMNADGSSVVELSKTNSALGYSPVHPSWSPDGTKVSYTYVKSTGSNAAGTYYVNGLAVAAVDGSANTVPLVTSDARYSVFYSSWSADGTEIFYDMIVRDPATGANLSNAAEYVTDAGGTRRATLVTDPVYAYNGVNFAGDSPSIGLPSTYTPLTTPVRMLPKTTLGPNGTYDLQITGGPVPTGATAVTLNLTGVNPTASTYLQAYPAPADTSFPQVSNLNLVPGQIAAVAVQVTLSTAGKLRLRNNAGNTGVIVDVSGYFTAGTAANHYVPITPVRATDTTLGAGATTDLTVAGLGPANPGFTPVAVVVNLTGASPTTDTYLSAYPTTVGPPPVVSNLNLPAHGLRANLVTVAVSAAGKVTIRNNAGSVRTVVDVVGFYGTGGTGGLSYYPLQPTRFLDTRVGTNTWLGSTAPIGGGITLPVTMRGTATTSAGMITVPATAAAYVYNLTVVAPTSTTYLTAYPSGGTRPGSSSINAFAGTVVPNLAITGTDTNGSMSLFNAAGNTPVILDLAGYYAP